MKAKARRCVPALGLAVLGLLLASLPASAKTITITATFKYKAPDGKELPCRWCLCHLRDVDQFADDDIQTGHTDFQGKVVFQYDSEMDDGWLCGRIDPYVRCYARLYWPTYDFSNTQAATQWRYMAGVSGVGGFIYTVDTASWHDNNSDRPAEVTATGDEAGAFRLLDDIAAANLPLSDTDRRAPMALGPAQCYENANLDFSPAGALAGTSYVPDTDIIFIAKDAAGHDEVLHEYGHREMCRYYGGQILGGYEFTRNNHSFEQALRNKWYLISDARWSALAEGWADFCPIVSKRIPIYRDTYDVEDETRLSLPNASDACEGTVCRIFWDISDTWRDKTVARDASGQKIAVDRPKQAGLSLDDDPFGFADIPPYGNLPGLNALKDILRQARPASLRGVRDEWHKKFSANSAARRALDAAFWSNGILRDEISEAQPFCELSISGSTAPMNVNWTSRNAYVGDVTLTANVTDIDPQDLQFCHVYFYWAYPTPSGKNAGKLPAKNDVNWHLIGIDINESDGCTCDWPEHINRPDPGKDVCIIAVASDFMMESPYSLDPNVLTNSQRWNVIFGKPGGGGGGDALSDAYKDMTTSPKIVAGPHPIVLCRDGTLMVWGPALSGELGDGRKAGTVRHIEIPAPVPTINGVVDVDAHPGGTVALRRDGTVWVWGQNLLGPRAAKPKEAAEWARPAKVEGLDNVMAVSARNAVLALKSDGTVWGWVVSDRPYPERVLGYELYLRADCRVPVQVPGLARIHKITSGIAGHSLALDRDGNLWSFGETNRKDQLGRTSTNHAPQKVEGLSDVIDMAIGTSHSLALCRSGTVWAWGYNVSGQVGDGTQIDRPLPVQVTGLNNVIAIAAGGSHSLALRSDGTVWCWGRGWLGLGETWEYTKPHLTPVRVDGLSGIIAISACADNSLALSEDGNVWAWGKNDWGRVGDGTLVNRYLPVQVLGVNVLKK